MADLVMELAGVDRDTAEKALALHTEVWLAVDSLLVKPVVGGEKYIPTKPLVDSGLSEEQKTMCSKGRWLQDKVNAVYSVAHSQTLCSQDDLKEVESVDLPRLDDQEQVLVEQPPSPPLDLPEKTTQPM
jgi:hypothetical protein